MDLRSSVALLALTLSLPALAQDKPAAAPAAKPTAPAAPAAKPTVKAPAAAKPASKTRTSGPAADGKGEPKPEPAAATPTKEPGKACPTCATCPDADRAFALALGFAFEPAPEEIRALAVEDLGLLGDPRALNPLASLVVDPDPAIRSAAIRAIRTFPSPRAEEILANVVRHSRLDETLKLQALEALLFQRTASAHLFLESVRDDRDGRFGARLQESARALATRWNPTYRR